MTESEAREVLLVRAFEHPIAPPWSESRGLACSDEALRVEGSAADGERLIVRRAALACAQLAQLQPGTRQALAATADHAGLGWSVVGLAALAGIAADALGASPRINILAPPLLALLLWNLIVYGLLAIGALRRVMIPGSLRRFAAKLLGGVLLRWAVSRSRVPPLARFARSWLPEAAGLNGARIATMLHAAAAALALGLLASMYLRGLAFEYRAGWESTFLGAQAVHGLLSFVLGPAAALSGQPLPDATALEALRFSAGPGENAARWIHWYAITVSLVVVLPRALLAAIAARQARRLAERFPLSLDDAYFARLRRSFGTEAVPVRVLPYSYHLPESAASALRTHLERSHGPRVKPHVGDPVPLGGEDELAPLLAALPPGQATIALFALSATPERETHGAFVRALQAHGAPGLVVLVDESGFRERLAGAAGELRVAQRREAWRRMLAAQGREPEFVNLAEAAPAESLRAAPAGPSPSGGQAGS